MNNGVAQQVLRGVKGRVDIFQDFFKEVILNDESVGSCMFYIHLRGHSNLANYMSQNSKR
jgi:hypothetical protein